MVEGTKHSVPIDELRSAIKNGTDEQTGWPALKRRYGSLVKPDITFFGEALPMRFFELRDADLAQADLLIVMGTSLAVAPFNKLIHKVHPNVPRLLINREKVGGPDQALVDVGLGQVDSTDLDFRPSHNYRDAVYSGSCDDGVAALAAALQWGDALSTRMQLGQASTSQKPASKPPMGKPASMEYMHPPPPKRQRSSADY